jgi:hypothetical protein
VRIERLSWWKPRYAVSGGSMWHGRLFREQLSDGQGREFKPDGRKRFVLLVDGVESASAARAGREWVVKASHATYVLRRREVLRDGLEIGTVRRAHALRGAVEISLPDDVPADVQAFIGFVYLTLRRRAAASSGGASGAIATGST